MELPTWTDPVAYARDHATRVLERGAEDVRPTCIIFEGEEPTVFVQARPVWAGEDREEIFRELTLLLSRFRPRRAVLFCGGRLFDHEVAEEDKDSTPHERIVSVAWLDQAAGGQPESCRGVVMRYARDDEGKVRWRDRLPAPDGGPVAPLLRAAAASEGEDADGMPAAEACYVLSRWGHVIGVAPGWRATYGVDRPIDARKVRPVDRRRAKRYAAAYRQAHPTGARKVDA